MRRCLPGWVLAMLSVLLLGLHGCASSPPTRFYVLPSLTGADPVLPAAQRDLTIGVGPVTLHPSLDRPQIVTRVSRARLILGEFDQWGAPLRDGVTRSLAENLSLLVPTDRVVLHPWSRTTVPDYQVTVEVTQFDAGPGGEVVLAARWQILNADEGDPKPRSMSRSWRGCRRTSLTGSSAMPDCASSPSPSCSGTDWNCCSKRTAIDRLCQT